MKESPSTPSRKSLVHPYRMANDIIQDIVIEDIPEDVILTKEILDKFFDALKYGYSQESRFNKDKGVRTYQVLDTPYMLNEYETSDGSSQNIDIQEAKKMASGYETTTQAPLYCGKFSCDEKLYTILCAKYPLSGKTRKGLYKGVVVDPIGYQSTTKKVYSTREEIIADTLHKDKIITHMKYYPQKDKILQCAQKAFNVDIKEDLNLFMRVDVLIDAYNTHNTATIDGIQNQFKLYFLMDRHDIMRSLRFYLKDTLGIDPSEQDEPINEMMKNFFIELKGSITYIP